MAFHHYYFSMQNTTHLGTGLGVEGSIMLVLACIVIFVAIVILEYYFKKPR